MSIDTMQSIEASRKYQLFAVKQLFSVIFPELF